MSKMPHHVRQLGLAAVAAAPLLWQGARADLKEGLKVYLPFDTDLKDPVGHYDGVASAGAAVFDASKPGLGKALSLDGTSYVELSGGEPDDLAFTGGSASIAGWFKVGSFDKSWQALIAKGEGNSWRVARRDASTGIAYAGGVGDTPAGKDVQTDGDWHHFVAISDAAGTDWGAALYIDGVLDTQTAGTAALAANGKRVRVGENPDSTGRQFNGLLDEIAIWNRVLTADEVKQLYANGAGKPLTSLFGTKIETLGVGAEFLLGGPLTDPNGDGLDEVGGATDPSWAWAGITSSIEPDFGGGENSFNIFDHKVGGGNDKWCCDDPTPGNPVWVAVQFPNPVSLTHFTMASGNDTPGRDPIDFAIQGSNDGTSYTDIYHWKNATDSPWTAGGGVRNEVLKFTLPAAADPYRYIRYIAYETPANLHQLNEIEYFGNLGGTQVGFISGVANTITTFSFTASDAGTSLVDPASVKLKLDGADVALGTLTKADGKIKVTVTPANKFLPNSTHTYDITSKDNFGNVIHVSGTFTQKGYALLTDADKATPDTTKKGFIWNVAQNQAFQANDSFRPAQQLAGLLGANLADPSAQGVALAAGVPGKGPNDPIRFEIETVINLSQAAGEANGNFADDEQMPGIPGTDGSTDGIAGQVDTYLELPAGITTMIVNSDDGFLTTAGIVSDAFKAQFAGEFSGGRGASDTVFTIFAEKAGVYGFRTLWEEGGGGANLEWSTVKADGTKVLVNDVANGGVKAYRALSGGGPTVISSVNPPIGATGVAFDTTIDATITDGADAVDAASVKLTLDGAAAAATATKASGVSKISFKPSGFLASGSSHTATVTYKAGANTRTETWSFTVGSYATLTAAHQATSVDKTKPGFNWNVFQNETYTHTSLKQTEDALAGNLKNGTTPVTENLADKAARGPASADGVKVGPLFHFEIPTVINLSQAAGEANGNFADDEQMPGIPGTTGSTDGIDAEVVTYVELPAGVVTLVVNSDDGFRAQAGPISVPADGIVLGQFDGGRGATDSTMKFVVEKAGVYPLRVIYQEGGGGANIEIFSVAADGTRALINGTGGFKSYRVGVAPSKVVAPPALSVARNADGTLTVTFEGTLETAASLSGPWTKSTATSPLKLTADQAAAFARARR